MFRNDWEEVLKDELNAAYFNKIKSFLKTEYLDKEIFPKQENIFKALKLTTFADTKVVIIGQDPYHGPGQATGLAFALPSGIKITPSLRNIIKELNADLNVQVNELNLEDWAKQGVLLLNSVLTVENGRPGSHQKLGWQIFTDQIIRHLNNKLTPVVFILWGNYAISKKSLITNPHHLIITSPHPSPLSAHKGFFGSKPFSKTNDFLSPNKIKWY